MRSHRETHLPFLVAAIAPRSLLVSIEAAGSILFLAALGWTGASAGGAPPARAIARVVFWGALAMASTALIGAQV